MDTALAKKPAGAYAWIVVLGCGLMISGSIGLCTIVAGSFYVPVSLDLGVEESKVTFYMTLVSLGQVVGMPLAGRLVPKMTIPVHLSIINGIQALAVVAMSMYTEVWMWYISGAIIGVCMGFNTSVGIAIILNNWFTRRVGFAIGLAWGISSVCNAVASPVVTQIVETIGWRAGYTALGITAGILMVLPCLFIIRLHPENKGLLPYGWDSALADTPREEPTEGVPFKKAVPSVPFVALIILMGFIVMTTVTNQIFPTYAQAVSFTPAVGSAMVSVAMVCDIAWNPIIGWTCDKFGPARAVLMWTGVTALSFVVLLCSDGSPLLACIGAGLNDTMYAVFGTGIATLTAAIFGNRDYAKIYSLVPALGYLLGCMGLPILTSIFEATGGFTMVWVFCIICDLCIAALVLLAVNRGKKLPREV